MLHLVTEAVAERSRSPLLFDGVHFPVKFADLPATIESKRVTAPSESAR